MSEQPDPRPTLRLVRGDAAPEEIAALLAVLAARSSAADPGSTGPARGGWAEAARTPGLGRGPGSGLLRPGPGAWRASGRPR